MSATNISILGRLLATAVVSCSLIALSGEQAWAPGAGQIIADPFWFDEYPVKVAGGPIWGAGQKQAVCYFFNVDQNDVPIRAAIFQESSDHGASANFVDWLDVVVDTCNGWLLGGHGTCVMVANIPYSWGHACGASSSVSLRGALQIRNANNVILDSVELR